MAASADMEPLLGVYYDNLNKVNIKGGALLYDAPADCYRPPHCGGRTYKYADAELGLEGLKLTAGKGVDEMESSARVGLSYANFHKQKLAGVETVMFAMGLSLKLGYYAGLQHTPNRFLLGLGLGF